MSGASSTVYDYFKQLIGKTINIEDQSHNSLGEITINDAITIFDDLILVIAPDDKFEKLKAKIPDAKRFIEINDWANLDLDNLNEIPAVLYITYLTGDQSDYKIIIKCS